MNLKDWMECANYRITEGSEYCWNSFGGNAYSLSSWNGDQDGHSLNVVFDITTQVVYVVEACDYKNQRAYRYVNPDFSEKFKKEVKDRNDDDCAWDCVPWTDLEVYEDWKSKARAIVAGEDYDTRVSIPIELPDSELLVLFKLAHERDMKFNDFVEEVLTEALKEYEKNPKDAKARAEEWKREIQPHGY